LSFFWEVKKIKLLWFTQSRTFQIFYPQGRPLAYRSWGISHPEGSKCRPLDPSPILNGQSRYQL
jgi:hypothetical protein